MSNSTRSLQHPGVLLLLVVLLFLMAGCQSADEPLPTRAALAETASPATATSEAIAQMPPTWTPEVILPTNTPLPPPATSTA
ncbi:MAG: hypothetical protein P8183_07475, partial [Anaerolineae bacterium]